MNCKKCGIVLVDGAIFCHICGTRQSSAPKPPQKTKSRGNGQGSVYKLPNGKYKAVVILNYYTDANGALRKKTRSQTFDKKKDAVAALPQLRSSPSSRRKEKTTITFKELYDKWQPTHRAGKSTMDCYKAAVKHFSPVWHMRMEDIDVDDLQECIDGCGKGRRTQENMKAMCGLVYKYGIPRQAVPNNLNLAQFLVVGGSGAVHRESFSAEQIERIRIACGLVPYAEYIYCLIYLGFRPTEFLSLQISDYDAEKGCIVGGGKTAAGTNRIVTLSPKIRPFIDEIVAGRSEGAIFCAEDGGQWRLQEFTEEAFYPALEQIGIPNPMVEAGGDTRRHKFTPHSCRHTFSTLMKRIDAPSKDKLELIGHTSEEMLRYYQDVDIEDLKKITDLL